MAGEEVKKVKVKVKVLGYWASPFVLSVRWALKLKGIAYEYEEEHLPNKSPQLVEEYNPVHKQVPVLVHNGKPLAESLIIIEYIDETWNLHNQLLPQQPYQRAKARFWAKFAHEKLVPAIMNTFLKVGEEQDKYAKEAREHLKTLESGIEELLVGEGESIGLVDIAVGWIGWYGRITQEIVKIKLIDEEEMPLLVRWFQNVLKHPILKQCIPPWDKLLEHNTKFRQNFLASTTSTSLK